MDSASIHAFLEFVIITPHNILPSHWLRSHITIVERMNSGERGINSVVSTIIKPRKDYWPRPDSNEQPPVLKTCVIPTELHKIGPVVCKKYAMHQCQQTAVKNG